MKTIWTAEAKYTFYNNRNYLLHKWSYETSRKFVENALHTINLLIKNPNLGKYNMALKCNVVLISKHISLHYEISNDCIVLIIFWDNRQNPQNQYL
jgi:plasmid stabilization system protein ParE